MTDSIAITITTMLLVSSTHCCGQTISIVDGAIAINGKLPSFGAIEAISRGGYLELETQVIPGLGEVQLREPFDLGAYIVADTPDLIVIGVLGAENRIDIEGTTRTSVLYDGPLGSIQRDLTVNLAFDGNIASFPGAPEPSSTLLMSIGFLAGLAIRGQRRAANCQGINPVRCGNC